MATIQNLIDRARGVLNEVTPKKWLDTDPQLLGWIATGLSETHGKMKVKLQGDLPPDNSPYWRPFLLEDSGIEFAAGNNESSLPADFDMLRSLKDNLTGDTLSPYNIADEKMLQRGHRLGVNQGQGYYTFAPGDKLRVLIWPGREGIPGSVRNLTLLYYQIMPRYSNVGQTVQIRDEFCEPAINYCIAKGLAKFRDSPNDFFGAFTQGVDNLA